MDVKKLAGEPLELVRPSSLAERWDIAVLAASGAPQHRLHAAAIGVCWPRFRRKNPYRGDAMAYSRIVIDTILTAKEPAQIADLAIPGTEAVRLCLEDLVSVEGASGFSDPPAGGTSAGGGSSVANSESNEHGTNTPGGSAS